MMQNPLFRVFVLIVAFASIASGNPSTAPTSIWTVTTADFQQIPGASLKLDDTGAVVIPSGAAERRLSWDEFLSAERGNAQRSPAGKFELHLASHDRVTGEPTGIDGQTLRWINPVVGELSFDLAHIDRIARPGVPRRVDSTTSDVAALTNGDEVRGIVTGFVENQFQVQSSAGNVVEVPLDALASVRFASTARQSPGGSDRAFRITLSDGSLMTANSLTFDADAAMLKFPGGAEPRKLPLPAVVAVEQVNGPVAWLSSLPPTTDEQIPFLGKPSPSRMDRTVNGDVIRFGDRTFARGIGVHALSRITWPLDGRYKTFRGRYALDGDLPYANVTVRVKLDDKIVHERADFAAGELSPLIQLPLGDAKSITLEVDYGQTYDVQDRLNWIEPALLKTAAPAK